MVKCTDQYFIGMSVAVHATHAIKEPSSYSSPQLQKPILKQTEVKFQSTGIYVKPCRLVYGFTGTSGMSVQENY